MCKISGTRQKDCYRMHYRLCRVPLAQANKLNPVVSNPSRWSVTLEYLHNWILSSGAFSEKRIHLEDLGLVKFSFERLQLARQTKPHVSVRFLDRTMIPDGFGRLTKHAANKATSNSILHANKPTRNCLSYSTAVRYNGADLQTTI